MQRNEMSPSVSLDSNALSNRLFLLIVVATLVCCASKASAGDIKVVDDGFPQSRIAELTVELEQGLAIDIAQLEPGDRVDQVFLKLPVTIYRRSPKEVELATTTEQPEKLADPYDASLEDVVDVTYNSSTDLPLTRLVSGGRKIALNNAGRSIDSEYFVFLNTGPETGCSLVFLKQDDIRRKRVLLRDPCSGALYDYAGRTLDMEISVGMTKRRSSKNLLVPAHRLEKSSTVYISLLADDQDASFQPSPWLEIEDKTPTERLLLALSFNQKADALKAIEEGANVHQLSNGYSNLALSSAIVGSSITLIKRLLAMGIKPDQSAFSLAYSAGRENVIDLFKQVSDFCDNFSSHYSCK